MGRLDFIKMQAGQVAFIVDKIEILQRNFIELPILDKLRKQKKLILHFLDIGKLDSESNNQQIAIYQISIVMANAYPITLKEVSYIS
ncbi:hypothetical protein GUI12_01670 [Anaplasmataceae bacterium AB001_6]|nr:hypothetical protein GUI12_01670 [Anaplasmataceae bacterium AB001_6]